MPLYAEHGGSGADLLVLLHGLGASCAVWAPLLATLEARWSGRWFAPDLPGHGRSPRALRHSVADAALAVGDVLTGHVVAPGRVAILGYAFGGAVAVALASGRFGIQPSSVCVLHGFADDGGTLAFGPLMVDARCLVHHMLVRSAETLWHAVEPYLRV